MKNTCLLAGVLALATVVAVQADSLTSDSAVSTATQSRETGSLQIRGPTPCQNRSVTPLTASKADNSTNAPVKPYPLAHCIVCGMLVKGRTDAFTFVYKGQEIKLCDKSEKAEFDRNPEKYVEKIATVAANKTKKSED
jgi:YHS domain-containing protein